jgi:mannose-6-phosphate isomerase-like protein (cupin superfamily)
MSDSVVQYPNLPPDNPSRKLAVSRLENEAGLPHIGLVGDTYTITVSGKDTDGRFCVIDMHVPQGGGPRPHRHDFEETFVVLKGEIQVTFRGEEFVVHSGETVNIPANAPHRFHNTSSEPARLLCICSPSGQEEFFEQIGVRVATRTTSPPKLTTEQQEAFLKKATQLASKYRTELLKDA